MKRAFVTASSRGIGKEIGLDLLEKNYFVYFNGHTQESTKNLEKYLNNPKYPFIKGESDIICQDLSTIESTIALGKYFKENERTLDVLVLNLGITDRTPFGQIKPEEWNKVFETNLSSAFFLIQELKDNINPNGKIIFISSISGIIPDSVSISYGVSKAAINMLVPYLAKEFADKKITVNAICPGFTNSDWHRDKSKAQIKRIEKKILLKRFAEPKEISSLVMEVINNSYINGAILKIDGGFGL
jgi:3-oxoacyl-[acyl-carrier protein] reductase